MNPGLSQTALAVPRRLFGRGLAASHSHRLFTTSVCRHGTASYSQLRRAQTPILPWVSSRRTNIQTSSSPFIISSIRHFTTRDPKPLTDSENEPMSDEDSDSMRARRDQEPVYLLTFTCKPCDHRSAHRVTKHGYHQGTVVITCPGCSARHVISDHLKIFSDKPITLEDILARKGLKLTKGTMKGDMEWWDGSSAEASADANPETTDTQDNGNTQQPTNPPDTSNKP